MRVKALRAEFKAGNLAEVLAVRIPASIKRTTEPVDEVYPEYVIAYTRNHGGAGRYAAALAGLPASLLAGIPGMPAAPRPRAAPRARKKPAARKKTVKKKATTKRKSPRKKKDDE